MLRKSPGLQCKGRLLSTWVSSYTHLCSTGVLVLDLKTRYLLLSNYVSGVDDKLVGAVTMIDELRDDAKASIAALQRMGMKTSML